jgi:DNA-binding transcriptional LysR family regulator
LKFNKANFSLRQLRAFLSVARHGSFTRAAEQLHITQAGLSGMVRELEDQLDCRLFNRTTRSVMLTTEGGVFLGVVERVLEEIDTGLTSLGQMNAVGRNKLLIGATPLVASSLLPQVCERFAVLQPDVQVLISDVGRRTIQDGVDAGELDAGYGVFLNVATGIRRVPLLKVPLMTVRASGGQAARPGSSDWKALEGLPLLGLPADNPIQQLVEAHITAMKLSIPEWNLFEYMHTLLAMAEAGLGVAVLPSFVCPAAQRYRVVVQMLTRPKVTCDFYEITKKGRALNPALASFTLCLKQLLEQVC